VASIKELEQQLLRVDDKQLDQQGIKVESCVGGYFSYSWEYKGIEAERQIKEHFAQCVNALAARQETLLRDLHETISKQGMLLNHLYQASLHVNIYIL
jgi:hypothetical protein